MGNPKDKSPEMHKGNIEDKNFLETLKEWGGLVEEVPSRETLLALHELDGEKLISEQQQSWDIFRVAMISVLKKLREKGVEKLFETVQSNPYGLNNLVAVHGLKLAPNEQVALIKLAQFKGMNGEVATMTRNREFWKSILEASRGNFLDKYQVALKTNPIITALFTAGAVIGVGWVASKVSEKFKEMKGDLTHSGGPLIEGKDLAWTAFGIVAFLTVYKWDDVKKWMVEALGVAGATKAMEEAIKDLPAQMQKEGAKWVAELKAEAEGKTEEKLDKIKKDVEKSEVTKKVIENVEDPYDITTELFVHFAFFEDDMEGSWDESFLRQSIASMKKVTLQELSEAVSIYEDGQAIEANYFDKIPESSAFNKYLSDYQRFLLCQRMVSFASFSGLNETESIKEHFNKISKDPLRQGGLEMHKGILEKVQKGDWSNALDFDFEKIDKEFFEKHGDALLKHAQSLLDPDLNARIEALSPEKDKPVLRRIQLEMLRNTNMIEMEKSGPGPAVERAIQHLELEGGVNPEVRKIAEDFFQITHEQILPLLDRIYDRYQFPGHENYIKNGLTVDRITFRHSVELILASKEMDWGAQEGAKDWLKDFTLLQIVLKSMDSKDSKAERQKFLTALASFVVDEASRKKIPFLANLEPYLEKLDIYIESEFAEWADKGLNVADTVAIDHPIVADSIESLYDILSLGTAIYSLSEGESKVKQVRDLFKRINDEGKENGAAFFHDKEGLGWLVVHMGTKVFIIKPIGTALEVVDNLTEDGVIEDRLAGAGKTVLDAIALPASIGAFLGWIRAGGFGEKLANKEVVTITYSSKLQGAGRGAKTGIFWKYHVVKWTGKKFVVVGEGIYNATLNRVENFVHTAKGMRELSLTHRSATSVAREAVLAERHIRGLRLQEQLTKGTVRAVPGEMLRDTINDLIHGPKLDGRFTRRLARGVKNVTQEGGKWAVNKVKPIFDFGIHEELTFRRLNGTLDGINKACGLSKEDRHRLLGEYTNEEITNGKKVEGGYTLNDRQKAMEVERQYMSALQEAAQNSDSLRENLSKLIQLPESQSRLDALADEFVKLGFAKNEAYGLANQIKSDVQINLMVDDLKRAGEIALKNKPIITPQSPLDLPATPHTSVDPHKAADADPSKTSESSEPHTNATDDLQNALDANKNRIAKLESKIASEKIDLANAEKSYDGGKFKPAEKYVNQHTAAIEQLEIERATLLRKNEALLATQEVLDPNITADALEKAIEVLKKDGREIYKNLKNAPGDKALQETLTKSNEVLRSAHYKLAELRNVDDPLADATKVLPKVEEATSRWAKSLKFIRGGVGVTAAGFGLFSIWETGKSTLNTVESYKEGRDEQGNLNAVRTAGWGANAVIDTVGAAEILGTTFATQLPKFAKFAARNSVKAAGTIAIPLMAITYGAEKVYDTYNEQTLSEGQWLKKASSYEDLLHDFSTTAYATSLGDAWTIGLHFNSKESIEKNFASKNETMRRIFKVLVVLPDSPDLAEALSKGADAKTLDELINKNYTPYHDYFFRQVLHTFNSNNQASNRQMIAEARTFNEIMNLRDNAKKEGSPFQLGEFNLIDERYNIEWGEDKASNAENFDPQAVVKAYREERLGLSQGVSEKISEGEKNILQSLKNMSTPYLLRLYAQLSIALQSISSDEIQGQVFEKYANLISNELELGRYITPALEAARPEFKDPAMSIEELSQHIENLQNGNARSFRDYEKIHTQSNPAVHALYRLAEQFGYHGDATEEGLKLFFSPGNDNYLLFESTKSSPYGIYWNGENWMVQEAGWERDNVMGSSLHSGTINKMIEFLRSNADDILEHRHDSIFWSANKSKAGARAMADSLEKGYAEGEKLYGKEKSMIERLKELASRNQKVAA